MFLVNTTRNRSTSRNGRRNRGQGRFDELKQIVLSSARIVRNQGMMSLLAQSLGKMRKGEFSIVGPSVPDADYARWIAKNEPKEGELAQQRIEARSLSYRPLVSIVMPVWNPPPRFLADTIRSVISQTYDNWELCIADGASKAEVREVINAFASQEKRVIAQFLENNLGISLNSNAAIQRSSGEFVVLLDHDDILAPNALFEVVACLNGGRDLDLIYSDKDHMTMEGKRTDPLFKPDWSPDMMLCANYVTQLCVIRSALLRDIGGFRPETDGAQDWDLILRVAEGTKRIHHMPKILYHWRQSPSSVSYASIRAKPYAKNAQLITLNQYLERNQLRGRAHADVSGYPRIAWQLDPSTLISIVIFDEDTPEALHRCITSILRKSSHQNLEIIVVLNRSRSLGTRPADSRVRIVESSGVVDFALANNFGAAHSKGDMIVFLNARTEVVSPDWLQELAGWCSEREVGVAGPRIISADRKISQGVVVIGLPGYLFQGAREQSRSPLGYSEWYRNCSAVSGACLATRSSFFREIGRFDERHGAIADVEFCLRARNRGYRIAHTPNAKLLLHGSGSVVRDEAGVFHRYRELVAGSDPYFNLNLSYDDTVPTLRTDP